MLPIRKKGLVPSALGLSLPSLLLQSPTQKIVFFLRGSPAIVCCI